MTMTTLSWTKINVTEECVAEYPYARFFSPEFKTRKGNKEALKLITHWMSRGPGPHRNGLLISGPGQTGKTHIGMMLSLALDYPLINSSELFDWASGGERGTFERIVERFTKNRFILDDLGDESPTGNFPDPIPTIIDRLWMKGVGIIATTRRNSEYLTGLYGHPKVNAIKQSCLMAKLATEE